MEPVTLAALDCPLRPCRWRTMTHGQLLAHVASVHLEELQLMVAGASGGRGAPVTATVVQHIDARQVRDAADLVASVLVPSMRAQLARKLARDNLRPIDAWPAVQVRRFVWGPSSFPIPDAPGGMRPALEDETPDLYELELSTLAVPDTRTLEL